MKRPAFQFYPADWRKDVELRACSIAARGLWIDMLCIAHECEPYGHLTVNGRPMNAAQISGQVGLTPKECSRLLAELIENGAARQTGDGFIYSKRMVDDEALRNARAEGGKAGSEHGIKGAEHGIKGGRPSTARGVSEPPSKPPFAAPIKPPPSSSSSSSPSGKDKPPTATRSAPIARPEGVAEQVWADWQALRKAKKAPVTATVLQGAQAEAAKARMTLEAFLRVWCSLGWQGLTAEKLPSEKRVNVANGHHAEPAWRTEQRERMQAFAGPAAAKRPAIQTAIDMETPDAARLVG